MEQFIVELAKENAVYWVLTTQYGAMAKKKRELDWDRFTIGSNRQMHGFLLDTGAAYNEVVPLSVMTQWRRQYLSILIK